jgi:hypothetical protein
MKATNIQINAQRDQYCNMKKLPKEKYLKKGGV